MELEVELGKLVFCGEKKTKRTRKRNRSRRAGTNSKLNQQVVRSRNRTQVAAVEAVFKLVIMSTANNGDTRKISDNP